MSHLAPFEDWVKAEPGPIRDEAFQAAQFAATEVAELGVKADAARDVIIRLRALSEARPDVLSDFKPMIESLTREVGLFPYVDENESSFSEAIAREAFRSPSDKGLVFHIEQQRIFRSLLDGKNVVASAPTSFGKSLLIDSLLGRPEVRRAAVIVPTLALLDETRRRILSKAQEASSVIFHRSQVAPADGKVIFVGTQERLMDRTDIKSLDLLIVDEFYKADPSRSDGRFVALNAAISKLSRITKQFFLIGPFIDGIDARGWRYADVDFIKSNYRTVAVDAMDVREHGSDVDKLAAYVTEDENAPALVFVRSPKSAADLAASLVAAGVQQATPWTLEFSKWLEENYTENWQLVEALKHGIGYHHGRLPRAVASALVRGFNRGEFKILLCTSTLIEGVNTAAKSVFIWDKTIDGRNLDFFTFANIRGRAGRMGRHYVGKVYSFHQEPAEAIHEVEVPGLGSGGDVDEILVHYEPGEVSKDAQNRIDAWVSRTGLTLADLKRFGGLGFDRLETLQEKLRELSESEKRKLDWRGFPKYDELALACRVLWQTFNLSRSGARTANQITFMTWRLYRNNTLTAFLKDMFSGDRPTEPDDLFAFLRTCEFSLPEMLFALQASVRSTLGLEADYSVFATRLENWFQPEAIKSLEEVGFPIVLFERLRLPLAAHASVEQALATASRAALNQNLSAIEREMIRESAA